MSVFLGMSRTVEELKEKIKSARTDYYNLTPSISDQQYDAWVDELSRLSPNDEDVVAIGAAPSQHSVWEKVKHEIPMGSLGKVNSEKEINEWALKSNAKEWFITHKIDGSSMELVYKDGKLIRCVTRGDGIIGEDVTHNISKVPSIPKSIPVTEDVTIRGEIVMMKSVFGSKYSEEYANPRNTAAGKVREKKGGGEACKDLEFLAYWIHHENRPRTMVLTMEWLKEHGFTVPPFKNGSLQYIKSAYEQEVLGRDKIQYEIDGMVVSINDIELLEDTGSLNGRPKGQIAWKFDPAMRETRIIDVKWQVGNSGRITPVAIVEPVEVGGVTITNISLHNLSLFRDLALKRGNRVLVSRRGDVIPYIERNLDANLDI